ncbi:hypothetical protein GQ607_007729 [Colletotrichum asianum]|uniref:Reverse transcriptase RNase H-like domain-containing protein n=1 Tax=Colletotrichum asianum TaxID=702518 RepID=A0A8H3WBV6_9PEZI|nr:hypothetical protein GQ607_007729 [Colletotrichum asianum]
MTKRLLNARQARWTVLLSNYNLAVQYRPDRENVLADALSRKAEGLLTQNDINNASRKEVLLKSTLLSSPEVLEELGQILIAVLFLRPILGRTSPPNRELNPSFHFTAPKAPEISGRRTSTKGRTGFFVFFVHQLIQTRPTGHASMFNVHGVPFAFPPPQVWLLSARAYVIPPSNGNDMSGSGGFLSLI